VISTEEYPPLAGEGRGEGERTGDWLCYNPSPEPQGARKKMVFSWRGLTAASLPPTPQSANAGAQGSFLAIFLGSKPTGDEERSTHFRPPRSR
jgi:hypothetical protein